MLAPLVSLMDSRPTATFYALIVGLVVLFGLAIEMLFSKRWNPRGKVSRQESALFQSAIHPPASSYVALLRDRRLFRLGPRAREGPREERRAHIHRRAKPRTTEAGAGGARGECPALCKVSFVVRAPSLQTVRQSPEQQFRSYSFAVNSEDGSAAAIKAASEPYGGRCPDAFFLCAGASRPGFFIEQTEASIKSGMEQTYYAQVFTALVRVD